MRKRSRALILILALLIIVLLIVGFDYLYGLLRQPLGPPLVVSTSVSAPDAAEEKISRPTLSVESVCGHTEPLTVLVLLTGRSVTVTSRQALALRFVKADFVDRSVASVYFPKELQLTIQALEDLGFRDMRLEEIFRIGMEIQEDDPRLATNLIAQALYDTFGVLPDHYLTLDLTRLAALIDAVGGVDVQVLSEYDATPYHLPHFYPGEMHMQGELALAFSAAASPDARWDGLERQTQVLKALGERFLSPDILPQAPALIEEFRDVVITDLSLQQGLDLACLAEQVSDEQVTFTGVDRDLVSTDPDGSLAPDVEGVMRLLVEIFGEP